MFHYPALKLHSIIIFHQLHDTRIFIGGISSANNVYSMVWYRKFITDKQVHYLVYMKCVQALNSFTLFAV